MLGSELPLLTHALVALVAHCGSLRRLELTPWHQLPQRPHRGPAHQRALILQQSPRLVRQCRITGVADRDQHVAQKAVAADAFHRRFGEQRAKRSVVEPCELGKTWRAQSVTCGELGLMALLRELVPGTGGEAIVAT